ncbi:helix-turn-helix domain-containing protein [Thalassotalea profundi]|uniref:HTH cro/C1-type domain-containing protein n=1 Tax=Thalassotalea profundi TaxID=2036687 RepID=A0ABQ3IK71_9GAMM|nr:helix-turn-helix transcriptional regulator [Thalassotalea profundi]GHE86233.1 hypothetical protein GCM10011501_14130 [Thalassotalea profundi]
MISTDKIKQLRTQHGWSQEQLAIVSGVSVRTIQRIEKSGECSLESKMALAGAFSVSVEYLNDSSSYFHDYKTVSFKDNLASWFVLLVIILGILLVNGSGKIDERLHINLFVMAAFWLATAIRAQGSEVIVLTFKLVFGMFSKSVKGIPVRQSIMNINQQIKLVYSSALFAFVFLALQLFDGSVFSSQQSLDLFVMQMAQSAITAIIYSIFFAEFLLRSAKLRLENHLVLSSRIDV